VPAESGPPPGGIASSSEPAGTLTVGPADPAGAARPAFVVARILLVLFIVAAIQIVAGAVLVLAWPGADVFSGDIPAGLLVSAAAVTSITFLAAGLLLGAGGVVFRSTGGPAPAILAVVTFIALSKVVDGVLNLTGWGDSGILVQMARSLGESRGMTLALAVLFIGVGAGVGEETFFRGWMQGRLRGIWGPRPAIVATAAAFGLMHLDPVQGTVAFLMGILLGWVVERTGSVIPAIAAHAVSNTLSVLLLAFAGGRGSHGIHVGLILAGLLIGAWGIRRLGRIGHAPAGGARPGS